MVDRHGVLVVEDDADIREALVSILEAEGYDVHAAGHGADALAQLKAGCRPCVILLDLMMPVMDGWTFAKEAEKDPELAEVPIVVVSAVRKHDLRNRQIRAADHLSKPVDLGALLNTVEHYC